jgi:uncharacterized protein YjiS (DUF1127 family)
MCRMSVEDARAVATMARDPNEIWTRRQRALRRGRLHGVAMGAAIRRAGWCVAWLVRAAAVAPPRRVLGQRRDALFLLSMNDRTLADIGLTRADVQGLACGIIPVGHLAPDPIKADAADPVDLPEKMPVVMPVRLQEAA